MSQPTAPPQPDEEAPPQPQPAQAPSSSSLMAIIALILRIITWVCLIISTIIIVTTTATIIGTYQTVEIHFNDIIAYRSLHRYVLAVNVLGLVYTKLQLPSSIRLVISGKPLWKSPGFLVYDFLGDKVLLSLLATGVGAAFGATLDLKKNLDDLDDILQENYDNTALSLIRVKLDDFFGKAYVSAGFLLFAFLTSVISSVLSSLELTKKTY
ncbi:CASP-like protein 4D1 [Olea europaea var. sylvestris]|uniref:CASP-like protein 4D1 n=1 Tax=Olea europaea var. sylvestris TaxID=158386 RepID=UPI000C1D399D|nr:CASP-like protein 4D1 [Olea europaea var. sylvestris]